MNPPLLVYRDDGMVSAAVSAITGRLPLPALVATPLAAAVLAAALLADGRHTGAATVAGWVVWVLLASAPASRPPQGRMRWITPPLLRASEYGFVAVLGWRAGGGALPATFALLTAVAFHHYDLVYRLRYQGVVPPRWVGTAGLGWEGRTAVMLAATLAGVYVPAAIVLAAWCGLLFVPESAYSWVRGAGSAGQLLTDAGDDDEDGAAE